MERRLPLAALLAALLSACGGGADAPETSAGGPTATIQKGGGCTGSCSGGGGDPQPGANPLPTSAPAPGVLVRESFGPGPQDLRPKGGKGDLRSAFIGTTLGGYWVEWPGSKATQWITSAGEATWKFTSSISVNDPVGNPWELPSPLEVGGMRGQVFADLSDGSAAGMPTALMPVTLPSRPWTLSIEGYPWDPNASIALGITDSGVTLGNLATAARVSLMISDDGDAAGLLWQLWQGGTTRRLLASGRTDDMTWNRLVLQYNPATQQLVASVNGQVTPAFTVNLVGARYAGFEGNGVVDDFVLASAP